MSPSAAVAFTVTAALVLSACSAPLPKDPTEARAECMRVIYKPYGACAPGPGAGFCNMGNSFLADRKAECARMLGAAPPMSPPVAQPAAQPTYGGMTTFIGPAGGMATCMSLGPGLANCW